MASVKNSLQTTTRLLLALWDLGGTEKKVLKGTLNDRSGRNKDNAAEYEKVYKQLEQDGAIAIVATNKRIQHISLTEQGLKRLREALKNPQFEFSSGIGAKTANALLKWLREIDAAVGSEAELVKAVFKNAITSYDDFKSEILDLFEKLNNSNATYSGLVPIWELRKALGERVNHDNFDNWMMEMQAQKLLYLQSGEHRGATEEQKNASIKSEIRGLLFYVSQPS
ncbi:MAG: hypothetical protein HEQ35_18095 [Gloeotrichia echinulata IR180]|jgi:hypothetical protein|nr:hypothetical protein [Gloeotrichia echinulata DEX184]